LEEKAFVSEHLEETRFLYKKEWNRLIFSFLGWSGTDCTITEATTGLLYQPRMIMMMMMSVEQSVEYLAIEPEVLGETCHSATLSATNPT
jgi:hypothetical protein